MPPPVGSTSAAFVLRNHQHRNAGPDKVRAYDAVPCARSLGAPENRKHPPPRLARDRCELRRTRRSHGEGGKHPST
jgi:hypothetical protein